MLVSAIPRTTTATSLLQAGPGVRARALTAIIRKVEGRIYAGNGDS